VGAETGFKRGAPGGGDADKPQDNFPLPRAVTAASAGQGDVYHNERTRSAPAHKSGRSVAATTKALFGHIMLPHFHA
jgi:hypothetical protein